MHVQRALRAAGRAGRVGEQVGMLGLDLEWRQLARPELDVPGPLGARPLDDVLDGRRLAQRFLDRLAHRHARAAAERVVGGDHGLRARVLEALDDGRRGEAGEDRHLDRADVRAGVRGDGGLGRHRHVDRDPVARARCRARRAPRRASPPARRARRTSTRRGGRPRSGRRPRRPRACAPPKRARRPGRRSAGRPRTRSSTRSRASRRGRGPTDGRDRARGRPRRRARTGRAPRSRRGGARRSRRSRARGRAG